MNLLLIVFLVSIMSDPYSSKDSSIIDDREFCYNIHEDVSRTFDLALNKLSGDLEEEVCVGYLMCRIPDTIEDSGNLKSEDKIELLSRYRDILEDPKDQKIDDFVYDIENSLEESLDDSKADWELVRNTEKVFNVFQEFEQPVQDYMRDNIDEMSAGMIEYSASSAENPYQGIRIENMAQFEDYCFYVAGTVGNLLTDLFAYHNDFSEQKEKELRGNAEDFGEYLQTINIVKDPWKDYNEENAFFIPESILEENGSSHEHMKSIFDGVSKNQEPVVSAIEDLIEHGEEKEQSAAEFIQSIPETATEVQKYVKIPYFLAVATSREAKINTGDALTEEGIKIDKLEAAQILSSIDNWNSDDTTLEDRTNSLKTESLN